MSYTNFKRSFPNTSDEEVQKIYDRAMRISAERRRQGQTLTPEINTAVDEWLRKNSKPRLERAKATVRPPIQPQFQQVRMVLPTSMAKQILTKSSLQMAINITNASPGLVEALGANFWAQLYRRYFAKSVSSPNTAQGWYKMLLAKYN